MIHAADQPNLVIDLPDALHLASEHGAADFPQSMHATALFKE